MNFFARLKLAWKMAQLPVYDMAADDEGYWGEDDMRATALFFNSHTGTKLKKRLNNFVFRICYQSVAQTTEHAYHAGVGRGVSLAVYELQKTFSAVQLPQEQAQEQPHLSGLEEFAA